MGAHNRRIERHASPHGVHEAFLAVDPVGENEHFPAAFPKAIDGFADFARGRTVYASLAKLVLVHAYILAAPGRDKPVSLNPRVKRADHLISAGLLATTIIGTASAIALWRAGSGVADWSAAPAVAHPVWLGVGDAFGIVAAVIGSISIGGVALRHAGSSALATFGVILLGLAVAGSS